MLFVNINKKGRLCIQHTIIGSQILQICQGERLSDTIPYDWLVGWLGGQGKSDYSAQALTGISELGKSKKKLMGAVI